jgi:hypothetical protein
MVRLAGRDSRSHCQERSSAIQRVDLTLLVVAEHSRAIRLVMPFTGSNLQQGQIMTPASAIRVLPLARA